MEETVDVVVLVDEEGAPIGTAPRAQVHDAHTPLHLAFSCYLFDGSGRLLMTRRAVTKRTWPGVWTNSFCGHPRPGETLEDAVRRHARHELGTEVSHVRCVLPGFRYRAVDAGGVVENELCPVFVATSSRGAEAIGANPDEVAEWQWITPGELEAAIDAAPWALSPWLLEQHRELRQVGDWAEAHR